MFSVSRGMTSPFAKTWIAIALVIAASWGALADDYVTDKLPSPVAKAYFAAAYDSFNRMIEFARTSPNKAFFKEKINKLIGSMELSHHNL